MTKNELTFSLRPASTRQLHTRERTLARCGWISLVTNSSPKLRVLVTVFGVAITVKQGSQGVKERLNKIHTVEVAGSNPAAPTRQTFESKRCADRSSGSGCWRCPPFPPMILSMQRAPAVPDKSLRVQVQGLADGCKSNPDFLLGPIQECLVSRIGAGPVVDWLS